jgi:hypothetical protein
MPSKERRQPTRAEWERITSRRLVVRRIPKDALRRARRLARGDENTDASEES